MIKNHVTGGKFPFISTKNHVTEGKCLHCVAVYPHSLRLSPPTWTLGPRLGRDLARFLIHKGEGGWTTTTKNRVTEESDRASQAHQ